MADMLKCSCHCCRYDHFLDEDHWRRQREKEKRGLQVHAWHRNLFRHLGFGVRSTVNNFYSESDFQCGVPLTYPNHWNGMAYNPEECPQGTMMQPLWPCDLYGEATTEHLPPHYTL
jgi:hypothetical protein